MRSYLKKVKDVSTLEEANEIFYGKKNDKELEDALEKYSWKSFGEGSGWVHVCSRYLTAKKDPFPNIEHRLYLNTESIDTYKMAEFFINKCDKYHLPYYFKFDSFGNRDDTIVIYSSTEDLMKYIRILQEIKKEQPIFSRVKEPPILTGKIDGWIGYGSEPDKLPTGETVSFNEVRSKLVEQSIEKITKDWILKNRDQYVKYNNQTLSLQDYMALKASENFIADLEKKYLSREENDKSIAKRNGEVYNPNTIIDNLGYTLQDIKTEKFKQSLYQIFKNYMNFSLPQVCRDIRHSKNYQDPDNINMSVRNGNRIVFYGYNLERLIQEFAPIISRNDTNYIPMIQNEIKNNTKKFGIDSEKICFDINAKEKMRLYDQKQTQKINKPNYENNNLLNGISTITKKLNPELLKSNMRLPNGIVIPAKQYIEEIVYPQLPENGIIILGNGSLLTVEQFIEEGVMYECQKNYNGDFPKYMSLKTRNNLGVISIELGSKKYNINPKEITNFINPTLLGKVINLPNGGVISAKEYIEHIYSPHIPANGKVILKNGAEISVIQYIEEILLFDGLKKYQGNIDEILYNTTVNNKGMINLDSNARQQTIFKMQKMKEEFLNNEKNNSIRR